MYSIVSNCSNNVRILHIPFSLYVSYLLHRHIVPQLHIVYICRYYKTTTMRFNLIYSTGRDLNRNLQFHGISILLWKLPSTTKPGNCISSLAIVEITPTIGSILIYRHPPWTQKASMLHADRPSTYKRCRQAAIVLQTAGEFLTPQCQTEHCITHNRDVPGCCTFIAHLVKSQSSFSDHNPTFRLRTPVIAVLICKSSGPLLLRIRPSQLFRRSELDKYLGASWKGKCIYIFILYYYKQNTLYLFVGSRLFGSTLNNSH